MQFQILLMGRTPQLKSQAVICKRQFGEEFVSRCLQGLLWTSLLSLDRELCYFSIIEWQLKQESFPFLVIVYMRHEPHFAKWPWGTLLCWLKFNRVKNRVILYFLSAHVNVLLFLDPRHSVCYGHGFPSYLKGRILIGWYLKLTTRVIDSVKETKDPRHFGRCDWWKISILDKRVAGFFPVSSIYGLKFYAFDTSQVSLLF